MGADVVDEDHDGGGDRAGGSAPERGRRQHLADQFRRNDDIQEFEDGVEQQQNGDGQRGGSRRDNGGDAHGGDESDAFKRVGHVFILNIAN